MAYERSGKPEYTTRVGSPVVCISIVLIVVSVHSRMKAGISIVASRSSAASVC